MVDTETHAEMSVAAYKVTLVIILYFGEISVLCEWVLLIVHCGQVLMSFECILLHHSSLLAIYCLS